MTAIVANATHGASLFAPRASRSAMRRSRTGGSVVRALVTATTTTTTTTSPMTCTAVRRVTAPRAIGAMRYVTATRMTTTKAVADSSASSAGTGEASSGGSGGGYPFADIEPKWQRFWAENKTFATPREVDETKPKFYALDMFPYPSGAGLHVGHPEGYTATDIVARYKRMTGHNVLHPMGWDAFGLPAEQYAIETGTHPAVTTKSNVGRFREQLQSLGFSYDWDREVATCDATYYKWTQWIFLRLLEKDLAYQAEVPVNWCPALGTVLANEEVIDGLSERGNHPVIRKPMKQWMLKITEYADRLLEDLDELDWPDSIKEMQRNWIGKSEGAQLAFSVDGLGGDAQKLEVYTTRPDTLFGATYLVVAPEHPLIDALSVGDQKAAVDEYVLAASRKSDLERTELSKEKTGVFTGSYAVHPLTGEKLPIWVADYVLGSYGTGSIMAVPAHDERDYEFAQAFDLPIVEVVGKPKNTEGVYSGGGKMINSKSDAIDVDGMDNVEAGLKIVEYLDKNGVGYKQTNYKLRDWLFARQRYWGEPFPVVFPEDEPNKAVPIPESELPLVLPETDNFKPSGSGEGPLANVEDWVKTVDPRTGKPARRETNTMPQWAGSCWYYLRFIDNKNDSAFVADGRESYWMGNNGVDLYIGGVEHAVLHLLYARFWHKVLYDLGHVSTKEPFGRLFNQGYIQAYAYRDERGIAVEATEVVNQNGRPAMDVQDQQGQQYFYKGEPVTQEYGKMGKSLKNAVSPDEINEEYGCDTLRLYEMYMGPLEASKPWNTRDIVGVNRFLRRVWRNFVDADTDTLLVSDETPTDDQMRLLHKTIERMTTDMERLSFNTSIAALIECLSEWLALDRIPRTLAEPFVLMLAPLAPHMAEELWQRMGHDTSLAYEPWPVAEERWLVQDTIELVVQVNGKVRGSIKVPAAADKDTIIATAREDGNVARHLEGVTIRREIYVPGRLVNIVAN